MTASIIASWKKMSMPSWSLSATGLRPGDGKVNSGENGPWAQSRLTATPGDAALYEKIAASVGHIIETQSSDGYIGNYAPEAQLKDWDIWGRKYTMLGLLSWYELSGDTHAFAAASRVADHLISQLKSKNVKIVKCGLYRGMGKFFRT